MNQVKAASEPLCADLPRKQLDKLFDIFRRSYNNVHVFANKKLEFTLKEQENDFQQREEEINYLEGKICKPTAPSKSISKLKKKTHFFLL